MLPGPRELSKHSRGIDKYWQRQERKTAKSGGASPLLEETCRQKSEEKCRPKPAITMKL